MFTTGPRTAAALAAALLTLALALAAGPASAAPLDATCQGTVATSWSPGLLLRPQLVAETDQLSFALCSSASDPTIRGASSTVSFSATESCLAPLTSGSFTQTISWLHAGGSTTTSTFRSNLTSTSALGQSILTQTGSITAGQFAGDTAELVTVSPSLDLLRCVGAGITGRAGTATFAVTSL